MNVLLLAEDGLSSRDSPGRGIVVLCRNVVLSPDRCCPKASTFAPSSEEESSRTTASITEVENIVSTLRFMVEWNVPFRSSTSGRSSFATCVRHTDKETASAC